MLLDSSHTKWFLGALAGSAVVLVVFSLTGGRPSVRLACGVAGTALLLFAALLALHRRLPLWRTGPRSLWMRGHLWSAVPAVTLLLCHGNCRLGGTLTIVLWLALGSTLLTGFFGLALQQFLPPVDVAGRVGGSRRPGPQGAGVCARGIGPRGAWTDLLPHACALLRRRTDSLVEEACGPLLPLGAEGEPANPIRTQLRATYLESLRPFLAGKFQGSSPLAERRSAGELFIRLRILMGTPELVETLTALEDACRLRRRLGELERLHRWLHGWWPLHVAVAVVLLLLTFVHAVFALAS